jgi:hypothetical protein
MTDYRVWPATNGPNTDGGDPAAPVNLGMIFQVSSTCWAKAIHFYRGALTIGGPVKGRIFLVSSETVVSGTQVDFTLSGTGWQTATLATPVQLTANTSYKVTIHSDDNYTGSGHYWDVGAGVGGITNGPLTAPDAGGAPLGIPPPKQGSFGYTSNPDVYPDNYFGGGNYWVDLTVTDVDPSSTHTGAGTAELTLSAGGVGAKNATGTGSAPLTVAASGTGRKVTTGTGSAGLGLAASGGGLHHGIGSASAPLSVAAIGSGVHAGAATATAPLALAAPSVGVHRGSGTGTALLTLTAHGATAGRDIDVTYGTPTSRWVTGDVATGWTTGQLEV